MYDNEYHLIYPDDYRPTEKEIRTWYADAIANDEADEPALNPTTDHLDDIVRELNSIGRVTLVRVPLEYSRVPDFDDMWD